MKMAARATITSDRTIRKGCLRETIFLFIDFIIAFLYFLS